MSRVGKAPIKIPSGVEVHIDKKSNLVTVKGPKGQLERKINPDIEVSTENGNIVLTRPTEQKRHKSLHGLSRSLLAGDIKGVSEGFVVELELVGVGYRVSNTGNLLELSVGYSHPIMFYVPDELSLETVTEKGKNPAVKISGTDKQLVGQIAAKIRSFRKPEPYKGKGVKYVTEILRKKAGKTAGAK